MVWNEIVWFQIMNLIVWVGSGVGKSGYYIDKRTRPSCNQEYLMTIEAFVGSGNGLIVAT